jgi:3-hydroxy-9,10-secoandrosta-1,3,5(10)-triene-9,17-dione monooxygenase reductase component
MTVSAVDHPGIDAVQFRRVLGCHATGVAVITALDEGQQPVGMAVTSFTSISLDPPLVAFCPDKSSSTWPRIEQAGRFCVNLLAEDQEAVCRAFAARGADKFAGVGHAVSEHGVPVLHGALASIECAVHAVLEGGDHWIVLGRVLAMEANAEKTPLLFFRSAYSQVACS